MDDVHLIPPGSQSYTIASVRAPKVHSEADLPFVVYLQIGTLDVAMEA